MELNNQTIASACDNLETRISRLPETARAVIAAGAAWRLMRNHLDLPESLQIDFVLTWSDVVSMLWDNVADSGGEPRRVLSTKLEDYYLGPYSHKLGEDALPGADEDAAAAAIYAVEAYCTGNVKDAVCAAMQLVTEAATRANRIAFDSGEPWNARESEIRSFAFQQIELNRFDRVVSLLETEEPIRAMPLIRQIFAG
ncbi:MAG: hypothetical protein JNL62_09225 [Bryobacterales bacterium]|nr:hypothetical protein [Bryobacterales bacterium]